MRRVCTLLMCACTFYVSQSQILKPVTVGEKVPDIVIKNIINYSKSNVKISDFRGKLIIFDFWETTCSGCIAALPKIQELQQKFENQIEVITVTSQSTKDNVLNVLTRYPKTRNLKLPIVIQDDILNKLFPFKLVSHIVWIGPDRIVKAITEKEYITEENIRAALTSKPLDWPVKYDVLDFDYEAPFLGYSFDSDIKPRFSYYTALTGYMPGIAVGSWFNKDSANNLFVFNVYNATLLGLCTASIDGIFSYPKRKDVILNVKDEGRYFKNSEYYSVWDVNNNYCYSATCPLPTTNDQLKTIIKNDLKSKLNLLFGVDAKQEERAVECWTIKRNAKSDFLLKSKGGEKISLWDGEKKRSMRNDEFQNLVYFLQFNVEDIPWVYDETHMPQDMLVDMDFNESSFHDFDALKKELNRYGLDLVKEVRTRKMYVITEHKT